MFELNDQEIFVKCSTEWSCGEHQRPNTARVFAATAGKYCSESFSNNVAFEGYAQPQNEAYVFRNKKVAHSLGHL